MAIYERNSEIYKSLQKKQDAFDFSNINFERVVAGYLSSNYLRLEGISQTLTTQIMKIVREGAEEGIGNRAIARNLEREIPRLSRTRALTIARTETHNAASWANHRYHVDVSSDLGIDFNKTWVSVSDGRTRPEHRAANGQTVRMDEKFRLSHPKRGTVTMDMAGDPSGGAYHTINCRCVIVYAEPEAEGTAQDQIIPDRLNFGETIPEELSYHKFSDWVGETSILSSIRNASPLKKVNTKQSGGAFYRDDVRTITMSDKYGNAQTKVVWRHEYGHSIDNDKGFKDVLLRSGIVPDADVDMLYANRQISVLAHREILKDRKALSKRNNANKKAWKKDIMEGSFNYKDSVYQEFGFIRDLDAGAAVYKAVDKDKLVKKIRAYLDDTRGIVNTKFLDDLYGKEWSDRLLKKIKFNNPDKWYVDRLIKTLTTTKYDYSIKNDTYMMDWIRVGNIYKTMMDMPKRAKVGAFKNELLMFSDFIGSVTNNLYFEGHSSSYYKKFPRLGTGITQAHPSEAFANYYALLGGKNASFWRRLLRELVPETLEKFDEIVKIIGDPIG